MGVLLALALASAAPARQPVGWRMDGTGNFPQAQPPLEWSPTQHVLWSTPMPQWSNASPIVVGDRIFVSSEPDTLICVRASDGRILWQRTNSLEDAVPAKISHHSEVEQESRLQQARQALAQAEYDLTSLRRQLRSSPKDADASSKARALRKQAGELRRELAALAKAAKPPSVHEANGYSTPTPTSNGDSVQVLFGTGVVASYDLDGNRRWIKWLDRVQVPNGAAASPVLAGGKLLVLLNDLIALDAASGEVEWRVNVPSRPGTPALFQIEGQDLVILPSGHCVRVADGAVVASGLGDLEYNSPLVRDGVLYMIQGTAQAFRIPRKMADSLTFEPLWTSKLKGERYYSSPLLLDGLIYAVTRTQIFNVVDAKTGAIVYAERLRLGETAGVDSVYSSITQGGGHVFVSGFEGATAVLAPGRTFQQRALNRLAAFRSNPVFDGDRIYVRGNDRLYCLSANAAGDTTSSARSP